MEGKGNPPPYTGYPPPPQQGVTPGSYPPPPMGYVQQPQPGVAPGNYPPPPMGYAQQPQPGYPQPYYAGMQTSNNMVVVAGAPANTNTVIIKRDEVNHCLHCVISFFFFPWIFVWIYLCLTHD